MLATLGAMVLGVLIGLRHAFEPDHLTAISTLMAETHGARRGAWLGAIWGIGHTVSLVVVGTLVLATGAVVSARTAAALELAVAAMLVVLGVRSIIQAARAGARGAVHRHRHGRDEHEHEASVRHVHVARWALAWRPLVVGLVHGLAGSGAITALVFAELPTLATRLIYITLFGLGSIAGMALASGVASASLHRLAPTAHRRRLLELATGILSVGVGLGWAVAV